MTDLRLDITAYPLSVKAARAAVATWARDLPRETRDDLVLAVGELVANGVRHGPDGARIRLRATHEDGLVRVEVQDEGHPQAIGPRTPDDQGGRGLRIIDALADDWGTSSGPNLVWFTLRV